MLLFLFVACLWDKETLKEEALRQKDVAEIVSGRILKHDAFFYEEKVRYTEALITKGPAKPEWYDDLAVALHKLGRTDDAIAVMTKKRELHGDGYTTLSNLGTFYVDKGDLAIGRDLLDKSVKINPNAHFGREGYQLRAIAFLSELEKDPSLETKKDLLGLKLDDEESLRFADQVKHSAFEKAGLKDDVFVALAGLIRFGSADQSKHVWFSLGMALAYKGDRHLSIAAFRRAEKLGHKQAMRMGMIAIQQISAYADSRWEKVGPALDRTFDEGQRWVKEQQRREDADIKAGKPTKVFGY